MKHKPFKLYRFIINLCLIILKLVSITRADFNTIDKNNVSFHSQNLTVGTSKLEESFTDEVYILNKTTIQNTVIRLSNTSIFLFNVNVTGSKILAGGMRDYSVSIQNCVFDGSEILMESANNVAIMDSHFIMDDIGKDEEPNHVLRIYNTGFLFMAGTHFVNEKTALENNQIEKGHSKIMNSTNLGMKMENVFLAELKDCTFIGIKSEKNNGSAIFLKNTKVFLVSCKIDLNMAKNGVIFGIDSVNVTSRSSSFISNYAAESGAVFHLTNSCSLTSYGSVFQNNSAREHASVVYAMHDVTIDNRGCLFQDNSAETGNGSVIRMQYNCQLTNKKV